MDAFYASVEQRDYPELRGRPVAVGGPAESRGVVAAASYEARAFGVRSAIRMAGALRLCPGLVIVRPDFARYRAVSQQVMAILHSCTPLVEPLSLDEPYLDVTDNLWSEPLASNVAKKLKALIREQLNLSASAGVAPNKFLAKIASGWKKPDGLTVIAPERVEEFLRELPVEALSGVGPVTAKKLRAIGIERLLDVRAAEDERLHRAVGSLAGWLKSLSRGEDPRPVEPDQRRKSLSDENTYEKDLTDREQIREVFLVGVLVGKRLAPLVGLDRPRVLAARQRFQPAGEASHRAMQPLVLRRAHVEQPFDADCAQLLGGDGAHARERFDGQLAKELLHSLGRDHREPVGLLPARGDLGEELVGRDARGGAEIQLPADKRFQLLRDVARERLTPEIVSDIEVGLVERQRLDERGAGVQDRHHLLRDRAVAREVGAHDDEPGAQAQRAGHRDGRAHAEGARLVARRGHHAARLRRPADRDRPAAKLRVVALLHRRVERIHVHVNDAAREFGHGESVASFREPPADRLQLAPPRGVGLGVGHVEPFERVHDDARDDQSRVGLVVGGDDVPGRGGGG